MATSVNINLIQSKTDERPEIAHLALTLKKVSTWMALTLVISGVLVGGMFSYLQIRTTQLTDQKNTQIVGISQDATKEGLLGAVKQRALVLEKILATQNETGKLFDMVGEIVPSGALLDLSFEDTGKTVVKTHVVTITDAVAIADALIKQANAGKLTKPELIAMALAKDGGFDMTYSFVPVL